MNTMPYCSGCDAPTIPKRDHTCPWCDTNLATEVKNIRTRYRDETNSVLTASVFTSHVGAAAMLERKLARLEETGRG